MIKKKAYIGAEIFDGNERHLNAALVLDQNKVCKIIPQVDLEPCCEVTSLAGGLICPGFVDIQVNGGGGYLLNDDPCLEKLEIICDTHAKLGTTAVLPTLISDLPDVTRAAHDCAIAASEKKVPGFCGLHLEGPHLAYSRNGAHDKSVIRPMDENDCLDLEELAHKIPKVLTTVASEAVSTEYIRRLTSAGIIVSLGHSDCSFSKAQELVAAGATGVTHLFNAMSQFGSREPGLVGAALEIGQLSASLIADGFHVDVATINTALRAKKSPGTMFLISDSMSTTGTASKSFELHARQLLRKNGQLTLENGTLAGADLDLASAVRFMVHEVGICQNDAIKMATLFPSKFLGLETEIGVLQAGSRADFLWLNSNLEVLRVWRSGEIVN